MAALGVGLAGNALAAPAAPPSAPEPALPALPALPAANPLAKLPSLASEQPLPKLFVFQGPTINTAGPSAEPVRTQAAAPAALATASPQTGSTRVAPAATPDRVGALSALDSTGLFDDLLTHPAVDQRGLRTSSLGLGGLG
jgi:hypothetical protein